MREGDILQEAGNVTMAHCVAADFKLSDGLAKHIKETFGTNVEEIRRNQEIELGDVIMQENGRHHILHVVTKEAKETRT